MTQETAATPTVDEIVIWFDTWLHKPIDRRDRVIIEAVLGHVRNHPSDIWKAVEDRRRLKPEVEPMTAAGGSYPARQTWLPMATAPQDGTKIIVWRRGRVSLAHWDDDRHARKPRPFWNESGAWGKSDNRQTPPVAWQPTPAPLTPEQAADAITASGGL
jgi:hypothetical protein